MTTEITAKVAQQARKWELLRQLLEDPEISTFLSSEFSKNGTSVSANIQASSASVSHSGSKRGDVIKEVMEACKEFGPVPFTTEDVLKKMKNRDFAFQSSNPSISVNSALRKLVAKRGFLVYHKPGSGRRPARYALAPMQREVRQDL